MNRLAQGALLLAAALVQVTLIGRLDPSFDRYRLFNASIERLASGMRWCEGPVRSYRR